MQEKDNSQQETNLNSAPKKTICHSCDALVSISSLSQKQKIICPVCHGVLEKYKTRSLYVYMMWLITALILCAVSFVLPFLTFNIQGLDQTINLPTLFTQFWHRGEYLFALLISLLLFWAPVFHVLCMIIVIMSIHFKSQFLNPKLLFKISSHMQQWNMIDVYLFGIIVTFVKLKDMGSIIIEYGFITYLAWVLCHIYVNVLFDKKWLWHRLYLNEKEARSSNDDKLAMLKNNQKQVQAKDNGLSMCHLCESAMPYDEAHCHVCDSELHQRKPNSLSKSWVWVITSAILYFPAMYFPVSIVEYLGNNDPATLIQTVIHFIHDGSWPVAIVIFVASVFIPSFKIFSIVYILINIQKTNHNIQKSQSVTKMYHLVEFIGRWSMIDVFVVALLVSLVQFGGLATIIPGVGIFCFTGVVITSMFAANSIDIRLLWDNTNLTDIQRADLEQQDALFDGINDKMPDHQSS